VDQPSDAVVHGGGRVLDGSGRIGQRGAHDGFEANHVARAARQALAHAQEAGRAGLLRETGKQGHGVRGPAEKGRPHALPQRRHLVGQDAGVAAAAQRADQAAHAAVVGGQGLQAGAVARAGGNQVGHPFLARRAKQRGDGPVGREKALADGLAAHFPAAQVRRHQDHALFRPHGGLEGLDAFPAHHAVEHGLPVRAQPQPGQLGRHLARGGDGRAVLVGREARAFGVGPEAAAIARRAPPHQPAQQGAEPMHQRHRQAGKQTEQGDH
jgi:hypothetical protein